MTFSLDADWRYTHMLIPKDLEISDVPVQYLPMCGVPFQIVTYIDDHGLANEWQPKLALWPAAVM